GPGEAQRLAADKVLGELNARMQQVYWAAYVRGEGDLVELRDEEIVVAPTNVPVPAESGWVGAGGGWNAYAAALQARMGDRLARCEPDIYPRARFVAQLGAAYFQSRKAAAPEQALPVYIRTNVANKTATRPRA